MNRNKIFNTSKLLMLLAAAFMFPLFLVDCSDAALPDGAQLSLVRRGLWVAKTEVSFGEDKDLEQTLTIAGENTPWRLTGLPEWLSASPSSGNGAADIKLVAKANRSLDEARAAVLMLESTAADYQYSQSITVNQTGIKPYIIPSEEAISFIAKGETKDIYVSSNVEWEAVCNDSWVSLKVVSATQLRITAKENLESKTQRATVHLVRSGTETTLAVITLTQAEAGVAPDSYETIDFAVDGETRNVSFTADASWTADASDASWLDISPKSGNAGRATLSITAQANNSANARPNGYVYIRIGGTQKLAIPVSQGGVKISVDQNHIEFDYHSQGTSVAVTANASWGVVSKPAWLDVQLPDVLIGTNQLIITPSDNTDTASRTGEVIIGRAGFSGNQVVRVTQQGADAPQLVERLDFPATAARQVVNIDTDGTWTAATSDSWIHLSPISGQGYGTLSVSVDANLGEEARTGHITIAIGRTTQTVAVVQVGRYITLSCDDVITASTPATVHLSVQTATEWTAVSNVEWLTVDPQQGQGDATLTVAVADNPSAYERTGGTITVKSGDVTQAFTFTQPGRHLSLSTTSLAFSYEGGTSAPVIVTTDGTYEVTTSEDWLTINRSNNTFTVTAAENSGAKRYATVTVALTDLKAGESLEYTISVTQPANPIYSGEKRTFTVNGVSFTMIKVEAGTFLIGGNGEDDGKPVHQVTLTNDYYIGETEVTQELWIAVTGSNPSYYKSSNQLPVEYVSWNDCQTFITKLNALTGRTFRLPTEAEWEFAARGGKASQNYAYSGSNTVGDVAWYWDNIPSHTSGQAGYGTQLAATKAPNELGIYDMSGNVWEWCQDWYGSYSSSAQTNPTGPTSGSKRVIRGGCWNYTDGNCRVANRDSEVPSDMYSNIGFRLALTSEQDATSHTTASPNSLSFDAAANTAGKVISVTSNEGWMATSNASWCKVSPASGTNSGSVTVTVTANTSSNSRTAIVTIKGSTSSDATTISIVQSGGNNAKFQTFTANGVSFNMIKVEGGTFQMGEEGWATPVHQVTLTNDYYIGETEVTQELWTAVMGSNPSNFKSSDQFPVERVSWNDCQTFISKLNTLTGRTFRLPAEAEWEFAARGGNASEGYTYSGSNTIGDVAWYSSNSSSKTHEVATKAPNELGIYDMSGNVWEWCQDWYGSYSSDAQTNPTGPTSGSYRVYRGGSWNGYDGNNWRVSFRNSYAPGYRSNNFGLRLALTKTADTDTDIDLDDYNGDQQWDGK